MWLGEAVNTQGISEVARDLGYWHGESVLQILKRVEAQRQEGKKWNRKHFCYE